MDNNFQQAPVPPVPPAPNFGSSQNRGMAVIAYFGPLIVIPFLSGAKSDPYVRFHLGQGLALILASLGYWIASVILSFVPIVGFFLIFITMAVNLGIFVLFVMGVINAASGKTQELPLIGGFGRGFNS